MRINRFLAQVTGLSRRAADTAISNGEVFVNGSPATPGYNVTAQDHVVYNGKTYRLSQLETAAHRTIMLNKPAGYVVSREGQGSRTVYDLLPAELHKLKPVGRLDKDSSGLLLLTDDGELANQLTHPRYQKRKQYKVKLNKPLQPLHHQMINDYGINLDDGRSQLQLTKIHEDNATEWLVTMSEGRNRQIRRTFEALGYDVVRLHRTHFGTYTLGELKSGHFKAF